MRLGQPFRHNPGSSTHKEGGLKIYLLNKLGDSQKEINKVQTKEKFIQDYVKWNIFFPKKLRGFLKA